MASNTPMGLFHRFLDGEFDLRLRWLTLGWVFGGTFMTVLWILSTLVTR